MNGAYKSGFSFGLVSGVITTLGLMIGLFYSTRSELAVIGGILTIAIADAFSDSLGMHVSTESRTTKKKLIWGATISTFAAKFFFALTFIIPILLFGFSPNAIYASIVWGLSLIGFFSYKIAKDQKEDPVHVVSEHLIIAVFVIVTTYYVGQIIGGFFV